MKLIHTGFNLEMELMENHISVLSIENRKVYTEVLKDLWYQTQGQEGQFILSEKDKQLKISKEMECIFNPFSLNCNDRKILNKLYQEMKEQADSYCQQETIFLNTEINRFLDALLMRMPYALDHNADFDVCGLLKLYAVEFQSQGETLLQRITEYLCAMSKIGGIDNYIFVGLKQYLTEEELENLYEFVFYEKINLILVEAVHSPAISGEKGWIIDRDLCIIDL